MESDGNNDFRLRSKMKTDEKFDFLWKKYKKIAKKIPIKEKNSF